MLIQRHGNRALDEFARLVASRDAYVEALGEGLREIGRISHLETHLYRRWILLQGLRDTRFAVRDAAFLGLDSMQDRHAALAISEAASVEIDPSLKRQLQDLASELGGE